jgi:8-oxo-dGTP diphosphatase
MEHVTISLVAKILIRKADGEFLVLKRSASDAIRPLEWDLPGGGIERSEDPNLAVLRELKEEAGLEAKNVRIVSVTSENKTPEVHKLTFIYSGQPTSLDVVLSDEHIAFEWIQPQAFEDLEIPEKYKKAVRALLAN